MTGALLAIARLELRRMLGGPRPFVLLGLALLVAALGFVVRHFAPAPGADATQAWTLLYLLLLTFLFLQTIGILVPLLHTSGLIRDELEEGTLVYLFTRPVPRPLVFLAKWCAASALSLAILALGMGAFHVAFVLGRADPSGVSVGQHLLPFVAAAALGVVGYGALFALVGLLTRRGLIIGIVYAFVSELVLANVPAVVRHLTLMYHLRSVALSRVASDGESREALDLLGLAPPGQAALTVLVVGLVALGLSLVFVARAELAGQAATEGE